jgi:hypothetical protein
VPALALAAPLSPRPSTSTAREPAAPPRLAERSRDRRTDSTRADRRGRPAHRVKRAR